MIKKTTLLFIMLALVPLLGISQPIGNNLYYNGIDEYVDAGQEDLFRPKNITVEMWIKPIDFSDTEEVLRNFRDSGYKGYVFTYNSNKMRFVVGRSTEDDWMSNPGVEMTPDVWQHLAATYDGKELILYLNGIEVGTRSFSNKEDINYGNDISKLSGLIIGGDGGKYLSEGRVDEVRIWNKVLKESEIKSMMNYEIKNDGNGKVQLVGTSTKINNLNYCNDLIVYYNFNESTTSGGVQDFSCNGNNAGYENMDDSNIGDSNSGREFVTASNGNWNNPNTWNHLLVPNTYDDKVLIKHKVDITSDTKFVDFVTNDGDLTVKSGMLLHSEDILNNEIITLENNSKIEGTTINNKKVIHFSGTNLISGKLVHTYNSSGGLDIPSNSKLTIDGNFVNKGNLDNLYLSSGFEIIITGNFKQDGSQFIVGGNNKITVDGNFTNSTLFTLGNGIKSEFHVKSNFINSGTFNVAANSAVTIDKDLDNSGTITIHPNATAEVTNSLINNGDFLVESTTAGTGLVKTTGSVSGTGYFKVDKHFDFDPSNFRWHLISSPLQDVKSAAFKGHYLNWYEEGPGDFHAIRALDHKLEPMEGFVLKLDGNLPESVEDITFDEGRLNRGDKSYPVINSGLGNSYFGLPVGFNLVGNPYPSNLDWNLMWKSNDANKALVSPTMYYYVDSGSNSAVTGGPINGWQVYNADTKLGDGNNHDGLISIAQGFGVVAKSDGELEFKDDYKTLEGGNVFHKKGSTARNNYFELNSVSSTGSDRIYFRFNENTSDAYDSNYDAYKLNSFGDNPTPFFISSDNKNLAICEMPESESVELGFNMGVDGDVTFSLSNMKDFSEILLEDKVDGTFTNLTKTSYTFTHSIDNEESGRFTLHFKKEALSEVEEIVGTKVYSSRGNVFIETNKDLTNVVVNVFNTSGQVVLSREFSSLNNEEIHTNLGSGIYIIKIVSNEGTRTTKINITSNNL